MSITKPNHFRKCKLHTADRELQLVRRIQLEFKTTTNNRRRCTPTDPTILPSQSFIQWQMHFSKYVHITTHVTHYTTLQSALTASPSLPPPALMRNRRARTGFWWKWISSSSLYTLLYSFLLALPTGQRLQPPCHYIDRRSRKITRKALCTPLWTRRSVINSPSL